MYVWSFDAFLLWVSTTACLQNTITGSVDTCVDSVHALWSIDIWYITKNSLRPVHDRFMKLVS